MEIRTNIPHNNRNDTYFQWYTFFQVYVLTMKVFAFMFHFVVFAVHCLEAFSFLRRDRKGVKPEWRECGEKTGGIEGGTVQSGYSV